VRCESGFLILPFNREKSQYRAVLLAPPAAYQRPGCFACCNIVFRCLTENAMSAYTNEVTKDQLVKEFNTVVIETEQLLKSVANAGGEKAGALRASVEQSLTNAKDSLRNLQQAATEKPRAAALATNKYVHESPWQAIGIAAAISAIIGVVVGLLLNRR
jgi:ElaB/YqjD/DUF883 family membrane-anchored ribosome-binding protein